jgi:hypothetical protein
VALLVASLAIGVVLTVLTGPVLFIRGVVRRTGGGGGQPARHGFGLNTAYAEANLAYRAVFSVTIPIVLVEARFGAAPYLRRGGVIGTGIVALLGAAPVAVAMFVALRRWSAGPQWTLRHPLAACFGALVGHTAFGIVAHADTLPDRGFLAVVALVTATAGAVISKRTGDGRRAPAVPPAPAAHP